MIRKPLSLLTLIKVITKTLHSNYLSYRVLYYKHLAKTKNLQFVQIFQNKSFNFLSHAFLSSIRFFVQPGSTFNFAKA